MSLHTKAHLLLHLNPTIAVLPETANSAAARSALEAIGASSVQWIGGNPNKGLSVAAFGDWELHVDDGYDPGYQWVMPVHVVGPAHIRLLAVWDMNDRGSGHRSARQLGACRASVPHYEDFLSGDADLVLISGDFNNSVYWDRPTKRVKFGEFVDRLEARGFVSAYHSHHGCDRGAETDPTLWWKRSIDAPYHIDYTFVSRADAVEAVTVGNHTDWLGYSDHSPMTVDLHVPPRSHTRASAIPPASEVAQQPGPATSTDCESPRPVTRAAVPNQTRYPIVPGTVPDMPCGHNGQPFTQVFRPTYFTAQWDDGVLVELRIWGPRVLRDGSLGRRELDHRWKTTRAAGGVPVAHLPTAIAERLRTLAT